MRDHPLAAKVTYELGAYTLDLAPRPRPLLAPFLGFSCSVSDSVAVEVEGARPLDFEGALPGFVFGASGSDSLAAELATFSSADALDKWEEWDKGSDT